MYLDIETLRLSHEVEGGWNNIRAFGLAVAVTWDREYAFRRWHEPDAGALITELESFTRVITFNGNRFDLEVLRAYGPIDKLKLISFDVHEKLHKQLGHRIKLEQLAKETLQSAKSGDGIQSRRMVARRGTRPGSVLLRTGCGHPARSGGAWPKQGPRNRLRAASASGVGLSA